MIITLFIYKKNWMESNCLKTTELLQEDNLLFTSNPPESPGTHLINLGRM